MKQVKKKKRFSSFIISRFDKKVSWEITSVVFWPPNKFLLVRYIAPFLKFDDYIILNIIKIGKSLFSVLDSFESIFCVNYQMIGIFR